MERAENNLWGYCYHSASLHFLMLPASNLQPLMWKWCQAALSCYPCPQLLSGDFSANHTFAHFSLFLLHIKHSISLCVSLYALLFPFHAFPFFLSHIYLQIYTIPTEAMCGSHFLLEAFLDISTEVPEHFAEKLWASVHTWPSKYFWRKETVSSSMSFHSS